jgi:hypothetical protein
MSCDFLQGLDIDALSPPDGAIDGPVLLPDGLGSAQLGQWFARDDAALAGRMRRCPARASNQHWQPLALNAAVRAAADGDPSPGLGLAEVAIDQFRHFWLAKLEGVVPHDLRYVVALPTPYSLLSTLLPQADTLAVLPRLEAALCAELAALLDALPATEIAIQWDVVGETRVWESRGRDLAAPRGLPERLLESFVRICAAVPQDAELGFHFCHQASAGREPVMPVDSGQVSRLIGAIIASTEREPTYVHVPVPADRDDAGYFQALANLALWPSMDVHLALLHADGDQDAATRRLDAARTVLRRFGIGFPCGVDPGPLLPQLKTLLLREPGSSSH